MTGAGHEPHVVGRHELVLARLAGAGADLATAGLDALDARVRLAADAANLDAVRQGVADGTLTGTTTSWGAAVGPLAAEQVRPLLHRLGLQLPPDVEELDPAAAYVVAAVLG